MRLAAALGFALAFAALIAAPVDAGADEPARMCGGIAGIQCGAGEFCEHPENQCHVADGSGFCEARPEFCTMDFTPVCGCDGKTYSNDCARKQAGAAKLRNGAC